MRASRFLAGTLAAILLAVTVVWLSGHAWLPSLATWLDAGQPLQQVDVVLALPGDPEHRPFVAAALVNVGVADRAVIVATEPTADVLDGVAEAPHLLTRRIYAARGVPPERVLVLGGASASTADDIVRLAAYLKKFPDVTAGIVTNGYHTRRARWTLRQLYPDLSDRIRVFAAPNPHHLNHAWWRTPDGMQTISSEYFKLAFYLVRYAPRRVHFTAIVLLLLLVLFWAWRRRGHFLPSPSASGA